MAQRITIIQGHPDPAGNRFCHALADAYAAGAEAAQREVRRIEVSNLDFPLVRTPPSGRRVRRRPRLSQPKRRSDGPSTWWSSIRCGKA